MAGFMSRSLFLEKLHGARRAWSAALAQLRPEELDRPGFCGEWSAAGVVAHIAWYEAEMAGMLERRDFAGSDLWLLPTDERNAAIAAAHAAAPPLREPAAGLEAEEALFRRLAALIEALPEEDLNDPRAFPGMPPEWAPWEVLAGNTYEHYEDHLRQAEAYLGRSGGC